MKTRDAIILFFFIVVVLLILIPLKNCNTNGNNRPVYYNDTQIVYKYDTIVKYFPKYIPQPETILTPPDTFYKYSIDSAYCREILIDYFSKKHYIDTLKNDSIDIYFEGSVFKNLFDSLQLSYKLKFPTQTITIQKNKIKVFLGSSVSSNFTNSVFIGANVYLLDRNENLYFAGVNLPLINPTPFYSVGFAYKLRFKTKKP